MLASGTWPPVNDVFDRRVPTGRSLAVILMAFCQGIAVFGVIVGLLAIFLGPSRDSGYGSLAAAPSITGALIGLVLIVRRWRSADRSIAATAALYLLGIAVLGFVVAMLGYFTDAAGTGGLVDWPFVPLGLLAGTSALAIGGTGVAGIKAMRGADEAASRIIVQSEISRTAIFELAGIGACVVAILLIVVR